MKGGRMTTFFSLIAAQAALPARRLISMIQANHHESVRSGRCTWTGSPSLDRGEGAPRRDACGNRRKAMTTVVEKEKRCWLVVMLAIGGRQSQTCIWRRARHLLLSASLLFFPIQPLMQRPPK